MTTPDRHKPCYPGRMAIPGAVQQAVDLLVGRLTEARQRHSEVGAEMRELDEEIASIEDAVKRLTGMSAPSSDVTSRQASAAGPPTSIRAAVKSILDGEAMPYSSSTVRALLPSSVTEGKTPDQIANSVRSALWSLRQNGEAIMVKDSGTASTKWPGFVAAGDLTSPGNDGRGPTRPRGVCYEESFVVGP